MRFPYRSLLAAMAIVGGVPAQAEWKEARSRNFRVYSEGSPESLEEAARKLEKYQFMLRVVSGATNKTSPVPLKVYLMSSRKALQSTMGLGGNDGVAGYYSASSRGPIAVGTRLEIDRARPGPTRTGRGAVLDLSSETVLLHEYAHHFMFQHFPAAYPAWYSEGFAEYYGSTRFLPNDVIETGHPASHRYLSFSFNEWLPLHRMLTAKSYADIGDNLHLLYAQGWLLVHYLGNAPHRKGQLVRYLDLVNKGVDYKTATDQAFGTNARELDAELLAYSKKGRINALTLPFKPIDVGPIALRSLSPAEQALIESEIALGRGVYVSEANKFAQSVRAIATRFPRDPYALEMLAEAERLADNPAAAAAAVSDWLKVSPRSGRAKLMQAQLMIDALSKAHSRDATAWQSARSLILAANKLAPADAMILEGYYDSFVAQGVHPDASAQNALYRALQLVPQDDSLRYKLAADYEVRNMIPEAITIIKPIAVTAHDSSGESKGKREKRLRLEAKYREVGQTVNGESAREMLSRLETKLAQEKRVSAAR